MAVRTAVGHGLSHDPGARLKLPLHLAGRRIYRLEHAIERAVEDQIAGSRERPAPQRQILLDLPRGLALSDVPREQLAAIATRSRVHHDVRADRRSARDVV